jgi:flagellin-like protein
MQFTARKAVSPIIATLLLIAIAVAAGIIVYVFTNSISGNLTQQGGQQVSDQISMDAYSFPSTGNTPVFILRNVGSATVTINQIYYDGNLCQAGGATCAAVPTIGGGAASTCTVGTIPGEICAAGQYASVTLPTISPVAIIGTSHLIRIVTSDGGTFTFSIIAGRSG